MGTSDAEAADVYEEALAVLRCFAPEDEVTTRLQFKRRHQSTEEFTIDFLRPTEAGERMRVWGSNQHHAKR